MEHGVSDHARRCARVDRLWVEIISDGLTGFFTKNDFDVPPSRCGCPRRVGTLGKSRQFSGGTMGYRNGRTIRVASNKVRKPEITLVECVTLLVCSMAELNDWSLVKALPGIVELILVAR